LVLSRKGREELKEYPLTLTLSRGVERELAGGEMEKEKTHRVEREEGR
jgi:hypothetical protein